MSSDNEFDSFYNDDLTEEHFNALNMAESLALAGGQASCISSADVSYGTMAMPRTEESSLAGGNVAVSEATHMSFEDSESSNALSSLNLSSPTSERSSPVLVVQRCKRGRPRIHEPLPPDAVKRPVGRPRGSGPKQRASQGKMITTTSKRLPGRPRKEVPINPGTIIEFGKLFVAGTASRSPSGPCMVTVPSSPFTFSPPAPTPPPETVLPPIMQQYQPTEASIIPPEDSQRPLDISTTNGEDRYSAMMDDGLGADNEGTSDDGDIGDEVDPMLEHAGTTIDAQDSPSVHTQRDRHILPGWLLSDFEKKVEECRDRDKHGLPPLYCKSKTFWFPTPSAFFQLRHATVSPQDLALPRFFLWDPEPLCNGGIACPNCSAQLYRHGHIQFPRRCVDLNGSFWIIGYRYRCPVCIHPTSTRHNVTFRSWDSRILAALPRHLSAEFPAHLSHRSGISHSLFLFMRSCFQNGMGAKQFSDALRIQHLQKYDEQYLQYLHCLGVQKGLAQWRDKKFENFLPFDDRSSKGPHGFVPSSQWLRDMYDKYIEDHQEVLNQHTSMLSGEICAIDHSHKITKHISKVNGVLVFTGLLTVTNEKGEIRICALVATKSHSQFELALKEMRASLDLFGLSQPAVFYTDNMADKQFLEMSFPSLRQDIVPVEKYSHLDALEIPQNIHVTVKDTTASINDAVCTIIDSLPEDGTGYIAVGLDSEWNVQTSADGRITGRGCTAVLQIAHGNCVFVLQIGAMLAARQLPQQLKLLLANPRILKAGRMVVSDLRYLEMACDSSTPFTGGVELAKLAKERHLILNARVGLADLCAIVLRKRLSKNVPERISTAWEDENLDPKMVDYAALDAYASLLLYQHISSINPPQLLPETPTPFSRVVLYSNDSTRVIARGHIACHLDNPNYNNINITAKRILVDVEEVLVPGAIVSTHNKCALNSFGAPPFKLVCLRSHVRLSNVPESISELHQPHLSPPNHCNTIATTTSPSMSGTDCEYLEPTLSEAQITNSLESDITGDTSLSIGKLIYDHDDSDVPPDSLSNIPLSVTASNWVPDTKSVAEGETALRSSHPINWTVTRSRVLKDPFHVFNMFYISAFHGLRVEFSRALRDAIFIPVTEDKNRIVAWGEAQNPALSWDYLLQTRPSWLWKHCKRTIPPPEELYLQVEKVFHTYGPLKDAKTGLPLFNSTAWKTAKNILILIRDGYLSDPPGIALYTRIGVDASAGGLPIYRCARGTTFTEGGVHSHLRSRLPTSGASIRHIHASLLDFIIRHNLLVGSFNSTGQQYRGHFSIWITNELQEMLVYLQDVLVDAPKIVGWVNGNLYKRSTEVSAILPIPSDVRLSSGMTQHEISLDSNQRHAFLALKQGTRKPVLPVHTSVERDTFRKLMRENAAFSSAKGAPNWKDAVKTWNRLAENNEHLTYKVSEQLMAYYAEWKVNLNIKESLSTTLDARKPVIDATRHPQRAKDMPKILERPLKPHCVEHGILQVGENLTPHGQFDLHRQARPHDSSLALPNQSFLGSQDPLLQFSHSRSPTNSESQLNQVACKHAAETIASERPSKKLRQGRTCQKCRRDGCPGRKSVDRCPGNCKDCGKASCKGRNSKRPTVPCFNLPND